MNQILNFLDLSCTPPVISILHLQFPSKSLANSTSEQDHQSYMVQLWLQ